MIRSLRRSMEKSRAQTLLFEYSTHALTSLFVPPLSWPTPRNLRLSKAAQLINDRIQQMIDERRNADEHAERNDFLSILLRARDEDGSGMSDQQLMDECMTLFGAGHETTAAVLTWVWYLLCHHAALYEKGQHEVDSVLQRR